MVVVVLALPLLLFALVRIVPTWNIPAWLLNWYYKGLFHYYAVYLVSFMALIAALFAAATFETAAKARTIFITLAFSTMAALSMLSSVTIPGVLIAESTDVAFDWSLRLSSVVGATFFALAGVRWSTHIEIRLVTHRRLLWVAGVVLYLIYVATVFGFVIPLEYLDALKPLSGYVLAAVAIILFLWAAWRSLLQYRQHGLQIERRLAIALVLLAETQIFLAQGEGFSWWLYQLLTVAAFAVALSAILVAFERVRDLRPARYFFALGSILILGLSLLSGELGMRWLSIGVNRWTVVGLTLAQGGLAFLILYMVVLHLDHLIGERTQALRREQRLRSELTQLIVHDLKNPLTVTKSGVDVLKRGHFGSLTGAQERVLTRMAQATQDILRLIDDLLDVERLETGSLNLQVTTVEPTTLLQECLDKMQVLANAQEQSLTLSLTDPLPHIQADKALLSRVIDNLVTNALKFTPDGGRIDVSASSSGHHLCVHVADNGPGVPLADRERIFEKFSQAKGTERRGAGLGLTFCRMVVAAHEGTLTVDDSPMGGALFEMTLPMEPASAQE